MGNAQGVDKVMLNGVTTGSVAFTLRAGARPQIGYHHHISWATGVTAGAVTIEEADSSTYAGTWAAITTLTFSGTAPNEQYYYSTGNPKAIRHRVSTTVSGGATPSVSSRLVGAPA